MNKVFELASKIKHAILQTEVEDRERPKLSLDVVDAILNKYEDIGAITYIFYSTSQLKGLDFPKKILKPIIVYCNNKGYIFNYSEIMINQPFVKKAVESSGLSIQEKYTIIGEASKYESDWVVLRFTAMLSAEDAEFIKLLNSTGFVKTDAVLD